MKHLDAVVAGVGDRGCAGKCHGNAGRRREVAGAGAVRAELLEVSARRQPDLDAVVAGVGDNCTCVAKAAEADGSGAVELEVSCAVRSLRAIIGRSWGGETRVVVKDLDSVVAGVGDASQRVRWCPVNGSGAV